MTFTSEYLATVVSRLKYHKQLGDQCFEQLEEKDFRFQPTSTSNSVGIIIQHLSGNMVSRWTNFLTEDGEKPWRQRDQEFISQSFDQAALVGIWEKGWNCFLSTLQSLKEEDLLKTIYIRDEPLSVIDAINRQLAHCAYHVGQLLYIGKMIKDKDWKSLSVPRGQSDIYNKQEGIKDPAKKFS